MKPLTFIRGAWLAGAITLLHAPGALATSFEAKPWHPAATAATHASSGSMSGSIVRTIVGLAIVIAVIYGITWVIRQSKASKNPHTGVGLEQIASLPLGPHRSVTLVRVGTELHLLGVAEHGVTAIRTFTEDEALDAGLPVMAPGEDASDSSPSPPVSRAVNALRRMTVR